MAPQLGTPTLGTNPQPGAPASLAAILALRKKPFLTAGEIDQARQIDAKQRAYTERGEAHDPSKAAEILNREKNAFANGETDTLPHDLEEVRARLRHAQYAIREAHSDYLATSGAGDLLRGALGRAVPVLEKLLARLEKQEREEAEAVGVYYLPSATHEAVQKTLVELRGRIGAARLFDQPDNNPHNLRTALSDFMDWSVPTPAATLPAMAAPTAPNSDEEDSEI